MVSLTQVLLRGASLPAGVACAPGRGAATPASSPGQAGGGRDQRGCSPAPRYRFYLKKTRTTARTGGQASQESTGP